MIFQYIIELLVRKILVFLIKSGGFFDKRGIFLFYIGSYDY